MNMGSSVPTIIAQPLDPDRFAPFGDIIDTHAVPPLVINQGRATRHHDLARLDHDPIGRLAISLFIAEPVRFPVTLTMLERHPRGPQCFVPMTDTPLLVVVAEDHSGVPGPPLAFLAPARTGICYRRGTWHGVLTPLGSQGRCTVIDWVGPDANLEEHRLPMPIELQAPRSSH